MLKSKKINQSEVFDDGILNVLETKDGVILKNKFESIRFGEKTVGAVNFNQSSVSGTKIEMIIVVPFNDIIKRDDAIELIDFRTGKKDIFEIHQCQRIFDSAPPTLRLSLKKGAINYVDLRTDKTDS